MSLAGPIVILGAGAVGSYVGGMLSLVGEDVVLLDAWPDNVEVIRRDGLVIEAPEGERKARPRAMHLNEAHDLRRAATGLAFLCVKLYDTAWAATLLADVVPEAPVVTMQNGLVEETVARLVGWNRTLGAVGGTLDVALVAAGRVRRSRRRGAKAPVFKIGELGGRASPRAEAIAALLQQVDTAVVTTQLWDDRWEKLCANTITSALSAATGLTMQEVYRREDTLRLAVRLGGEACAVGRLLGFAPKAVMGLAPERWEAASGGDRTATAEVEAALSSHSATMVEGGRSGTLQDILKGRRTEVEFFNGYIAERARECGTGAPTHAALATLIRRMEAGEAHPTPDHLLAL
jgi:2-dehydropantoate 2-reductase